MLHQFLCAYYKIQIFPRTFELYSNKTVCYYHFKYTKGNFVTLRRNALLSSSTSPVFSSSNKRTCICNKLHYHIYTPTRHFTTPVYLHILSQKAITGFIVVFMFKIAGYKDFLDSLRHLLAYHSTDIPPRKKLLTVESFLFVQNWNGNPTVLSSLFINHQHHHQHHHQHRHQLIYQARI